MIRWILVLSLSFCTLQTMADEILRLGSPAPLLRVDKWLRGSSPKAFAPGQVYVINFWATWSGANAELMPILMNIQTQFSDKNVHVIGIAAQENGDNPYSAADKVDRWLHENQPNLNYAVGFESQHHVERNWTEPGLASGLPITFVVDGGGRIAYIGKSKMLLTILPAIVDGTWQTSAAAHAYELQRVQRGLQSQRDNLSCRAIYGFLMPAMHAADWPRALAILQGGLEAVPDCLDFQILRLDILLLKLKDATRGGAALTKYVDLHVAGQESRPLRSGLDMLAKSEQLLPADLRTDLKQRMQDRWEQLCAPNLIAP